MIDLSLSNAYLYACSSLIWTSNSNSPVTYSAKRTILHMWVRESRVFFPPVWLTNLTSFKLVSLNALIYVALISVDLQYLASLIKCWAAEDTKINVCPIKISQSPVTYPGDRVLSTWTQNHSSSIHRRSNPEASWRLTYDDPLEESPIVSASVNLPIWQYNLHSSKKSPPHLWDHFCQSRNVEHSHPYRSPSNTPSMTDLLTAISELRMPLFFLNVMNNSQSAE